MVFPPSTLSPFSSPPSISVVPLIFSLSFAAGIALPNSSMMSGLPVK